MVSNVSVLAWFLFVAVGDVYRDLGGEYFQSVFQLLNPAYLEALRSHFFENQMVSELLSLRFYQSKLLTMMLWIIGSGSLAVMWLFLSRQRDAVCRDGIMTGGTFYKWDKVVGYSWGKCCAKKWHSKENWYHELTIEVKHGRLFAKIFGEEVIKITLQVSADDKEPVDLYLFSPPP